VFASASWRYSPSIGFQLGVGALLDGSIEIDGTTGDVGPGVAASVGVSWLAVYERRRRPFVQVSTTIAASTTTAVSDDGASHRLSAGDLRVDVMVGKTFADRATPYLATRAFAGPVSWKLDGESVTGGDAHHYGVGVGTVLRLGELDLFAEVTPLGEQRAALGAGYSF